MRYICGQYPFLLDSAMCLKAIINSDQIRNEMLNNKNSLIIMKGLKTGIFYRNMYYMENASCDCVSLSI